MLNRSTKIHKDWNKLSKILQKVRCGSWSHDPFETDFHFSDTEQGHWSLRLTIDYMFCSICSDLATTQLWPPLKNTSYFDVLQSSQYQKASRLLSFYGDLSCIFIIPCDVYFYWGHLWSCTVGSYASLSVCLCWKFRLEVNSYLSRYCT